MRPGDSNQINRSYLDSLLIEMNHIGAVRPDTTLELFGHTFKTPVMTAALSHIEKFGIHSGGMPELARGAVAAGAVLWAGMGSEKELEKIVKTGAKTIKIVKPEANNNAIIRKLKHAEACGCIAVGIDLDHAFDKRGEYDVIDDIVMAGKSSEEIEEFVEAIKIPFIVKGVLDCVDAQICQELGVRGIVVSHHHGIMDFAVPPLLVMPEIVEAVDKATMSIFVDCGMESGYDVFKAMARGADAVSIGRALLDPLKNKGAEGVAERINEITAELRGVMARTSCADLFEIKETAIIRQLND